MIGILQNIFFFIGLHIILNVLWENAIGDYTYVLPYLNTGLLNMS